MKVNGQLERAQLEQISGDSGTPGIRGRVYADITDTSNAVPKFCTGSAEKTLAFVENASLISQNLTTSTYEVTVDWSQGLVQRVVLQTDGLIKFSNPQSNKEHVLIVQQAAIGGGVLYNYSLDMANQDPNGKSYQPIGTISESRTRVHRWYYNSSAITPGYTSTVPRGMTANAAAATAATGISVHPSGEYVTMGRTSSPYSSVYELAKGPLGPSLNIAQGLSAVTPAALTAQARAVKHSPDGRVVFFAGASSPYIEGWFHNRGASLGSRITNPGTLPTGAGQCIDVHPSGMFVAIGHTTTPFMSVYPFTGDGYGSKLSNPSTLPAAQVNSVAFSPCGAWLAVASQTTPFIQVYSFVGNNVGSGAISTDVLGPGTLPTGGPAGQLGKGIAWHPSGNYIAMANSTSPYIYITAFNRALGSYGSVIVPNSAPPGATTCVQWSPDGNFLWVGSGTTPYLHVYDTSNLPTVGDPMTLTTTPAGQVNDISFHPTGDYAVLALNASPFTMAVVSPFPDRNYLRLA